MCKILAFAFFSVYLSALHETADAIRSPDEEDPLDASPSLIELSGESAVSGEIQSSEEFSISRAGEIWQAFDAVITKKGTKTKMEANATGQKALSIWSQLLKDPSVEAKCTQVGLVDIINDLAKDPSRKDTYLAQEKLKELDRLMLQKLKDLQLDYKTLEEATAKVVGAKSASVTSPAGSGFAQPGLKITVNGFPEDPALNGEGSKTGNNIKAMNGAYLEDLSPTGENCVNGKPTYWNSAATLPKTFLYFCKKSNTWLITKKDDWAKVKVEGKCMALAFFKGSDVTQRNPYLPVSMVKIKGSDWTWATNATSDAACRESKLQCTKEDWVKNIGVSGIENLGQMQTYDCSQMKPKE